MSADNGIYIAKIPVANRFEYRVAYASAIDNCFLTGSPYFTYSEEEEDWYRVLYFGDAKNFGMDYNKAVAYAHEEAGQCDVLEYGVSEIEFGRPLLDMTHEEANKKLNAYNDKIQAEKRKQNKIEDAKRKVERDKKEAEKKYLLDSISMPRRTDNSGMRHHERMLAVIDWAEAQLKK